MDEKERQPFQTEEPPREPQPARCSRKRLIIVGVVIAIVVVVAIVVPVVLTQTTSMGGLTFPTSSAPRELWCFSQKFLRKKFHSEETSWNPNHKCGLYLPEGVDMDNLGGPKLISGRHTCDLKGTCWNKEQCYPCLLGPNSDRVGNINNMPVCCPNCERHGLTISWDSCDC